MKEIKLDPTVIEFKRFINNHPKLIKVIRQEGRGWQEYYEKWVLLGEDDLMWDQYKEVSSERKETEHDFLHGLLTLTENFDMKNIDKYMGHLSTAIQMIQELLNNYNDNKRPPEKSKGRSDAPNWFRD